MSDFLGAGILVVLIGFFILIGFILGFSRGTVHGQRIEHCFQQNATLMSDTLCARPDSSFAVPARFR